MGSYSFKIKQRLQKVLRSFGYEVRRVRDESQHWQWLREYNIATVLDVGANVGEFTDCIWHILPQARIYAFEPISRCYHTLIRKYAGHSRFKAFNVAMGDKSEKVLIMENEFLPSSSILPLEQRHREAFPYASRVKPVEVEMMTLDAMQSLFTLEPGVLLKLDVQGYEDKVLAGAKDLLPKVDVAIIEVSFVELYTDQSLFKEIHSLMSRHGFEFIGCGEPTRDPSTGRVLQADAFFIRKNQH